MQQLPPFPDETPEPSTPGQPTPAPREEPPQPPDIDVPAPPTPGTATGAPVARPVDAPAVDARAVGAPSVGAPGTTKAPALGGGLRWCVSTD